MRVLVTGAGGMLGRAVCTALEAAEMECLPTGRTLTDMPLDITERAAVERVLDEKVPDAVLHCAAYTQVDRAEQEPEAAYRVNALGSWNLALACAARGIALCAVSTDFVFDGTQKEPYSEWDTPNPLSVYGKSKLAGESLIRQHCPKHWIVRTAWLFGPDGNCFPKTILRAAAVRPELRVVADQRGCPTYTPDLARALVRLIRTPQYGNYHITNQGTATWYTFADRLLTLTGKTETRLLPIRSADWNAPARRPANSVLRNHALVLCGEPLLRSWEEALTAFLADYGATLSI